DAQTRTRPARLAGGGLHCRGGGPAGAGVRLPEATDPHGRDLPARRQRRRGGAHADAAPQREAGPAGGGGQPARRGRQHRLEPGGQGAARRLHAGCGRGGRALGQQQPVRQDAVRPAARLQAGEHAGGDPVRDHRQSFRGREDAEGPDRPRAVAAGQAVDGARGQRHGDASLGRALQPDGERQVRRGAVQGFRPRRIGRARQQRATRRGGPAIGAAAHSRRQAHRLCGDEPAAPAATARRAHGRRSRPARLRLHGLVWRGGAGRHARLRDPEAERRDHRGAEGPADRHQHAQPGRRARAHHAGSVRELHPQRDAEVVQGDPRSQHQDRPV
ncbi:MAG: BUG/TctC family periplasmic protein, partial [uncultured Ramlibacter sp.]